MDVQAIANQSVIRARESTENVPAGRRIRDISKKIHKLDPDAAPFTLLLSRAKTETCNEPKYEWMQEELPAKWSQLTVADAVVPAAGTVTTFTVAHARYFSVGDVVNVVRTGEKVRVEAVNVVGGTISVVRGVGNTTPAATALNDDLQVIGNAYAEGSPVGLEKSMVETFLFNYVQIFRHAFGETGTQAATVGYVGKGKTRLTQQKAIEHKLDLERAAMFGERAIDTTSTNNPRRYTGGAMYFLTSNIRDAGGTLTAPEVWSWMQDVYQHTGASGSSRTLFASPLLITTLDQFALTTGNVSVNVAPTDKTFGLSVTQWQSSHGGFNIIKHRLLENGLGGQGYGGHGFLLDPAAWYLRHLPGRNTQLRENIGNKGDDAWTDEYFSEVGFQVTLPETQGILKGVTG